MVSFQALKSRRIVTPDGMRSGAVVMRAGRILGVVGAGEIPPACTVTDVGDAMVMPGLIDPHVHLNEPGRTEWEGFATATRAAAAGGVTTLVDMPLNSTPVTTCAEAFAEKIRSARGQLRVDCGFYGGVVPGNTADLTPLIRAGVMGLKAFLVHSGIDDFPNVTATDLRAAMPVIARFGVPLLVHAEWAAVPAQGLPDPKKYVDFLASRPAAWEEDAVAMMIGLCEETGCRVHIVHLSAASALPALRRARAAGLPLTVETCPHYLYFDAETIPDADPRYKCAPPIRDRANRERLWEALADGTIDFLATDHSPCPPALKCLKTGDLAQAWGGIASLQFALPVVWTEARRRGYGPEALAEWMSRRPAAWLGLAARKGRIAPGCDADLVVWQPEASFEVAAEDILFRHPVTPYEGRTLFGVVMQTYLRGQPVYERGQEWGIPVGDVLRRTG